MLSINLLIKNLIASQKLLVFSLLPLHVRVFTREGIDKDARALEIQNTFIVDARKNLEDELRINQENIYTRTRKLLLNKQIAKGTKDVKAGSKISQSILDNILDNSSIFGERTASESGTLRPSERFK